MEVDRLRTEGRVVCGIAVIGEPSADGLATGKISFHDCAKSHDVDSVRLSLFEVGQPSNGAVDPAPFVRTATRVVQAYPRIAILVRARRCKV